VHICAHITYILLERVVTLMTINQHLPSYHSHYHMISEGIQQHHLEMMMINLADSNKIEKA
jgi:hypothetical protein